MNYQGAYSRLVARAVDRQKSGYMERHHVIPKCLGGKDAPANMVWLTAEEHYIAHLLLVKIHPGNHRLLWAVTCMTGPTPLQSGRKNKMYGWVRRQFALYVGKRNKGRRYTSEQTAAMSERMTGTKRGKYRPRTAPSSLKGKPKSDAHKLALSKAKKGTGYRSDAHKLQFQSVLEKQRAMRIH